MTQTAPRRTPPQPELFGPGDLFWEFSGQRLYAATAGGAFLLQVMHPAIGAVVDAHSTYRTDTWGRAARSFASVQTWIYGGRTALDESARLRVMHRTLEATDEQGRHHHALSADAWAFVPLTAYFINFFYVSRFVPGVEPDEQRLYDETLRMCRILQVQERLLPPTPAAYWDYLDHMIDDVLEDHPTAHNLLAVIDSGPCPPWLPAPLQLLWRVAGAKPAASVTRLVTVGGLPESARDKLGLPWRKSDELELRAIARVLGEANARLPERVKYLPIAYSARKAARAHDRLQNTLAARPL